MFEELSYASTPIGELSLRRRHELRAGIDVYEIKLGDEFLMSSMFTHSEIALAQKGISIISDHEIDVVVGGLGLGYTANAVLEHTNVVELLIVEMLEPVVEWHRNGLLPLGPTLTNDDRCRMVIGDFFAMAGSPTGFDPASPGRKFDAVLLDIDHSPEYLLSDRSSHFYDLDGLRTVATHLRRGGVFGLWSNDLPDARFTERLKNVFANAWHEKVTFYNMLQDNWFTQTIYLARTGINPDNDTDGTSIPGDLDANQKSPSNTIQS